MERCDPTVHRIIGNLQTWLNGTHHGVGGPPKSTHGSFPTLLGLTTQRYHGFSEENDGT
jgi:hypothetical protein